MSLQWDAENVARGKAGEARVADFLRRINWTVETAEEACDEHSAGEAPLTRLLPEVVGKLHCPGCGRTFTPEYPHHQYHNYPCKLGGPSIHVCPEFVPTPDFRVTKGGMIRWVEVKAPGDWAHVDVRGEQLSGYRWLQTKQPDVPLHLFFVIGGETMWYVHLPDIRGRRRSITSSWNNDGIPDKSWLHVDPNCLIQLDQSGT